ncbi:T-cell surface glycoprotein CD8 alpha chain [Arapaima gigas]
MSENFVQIFILVFFQLHCAYQYPTVYEEGQEVSISCPLKHSSSAVFWFRIVKNGLDFIGTFTYDGTPKTQIDASVFNYGEIKNQKLIVKNFNKNRDSGTYSCAYINANKLFFGEATVIEGKADPKPTVKTTTKMTSTTIQPCVCPTSKKVPTAGCRVLIWAPLAAGCSLLLLILILTIYSCNRIRTRRCPHHHRRKRKNVMPVRHDMTDRHPLPVMR